MSEAHRASVEKLLGLVEGHNKKLLSIENRFKRFKNEFDDIKVDLNKIRVQNTDNVQVQDPQVV